MRKNPSFFGFSSVIWSQCLAELIFTSLIRIRRFSALNPKSKHYVTLATPRVVPVTRQSVYTKKSCPACQGYPTCQGDTTHPTELSRPPRRVCDPNVNGWLNLERNKLNVTSARVARGEGRLGCPRPYKWGISNELVILFIYQGFCSRSLINYLFIGACFMIIPRDCYWTSYMMSKLVIRKKI